MINKIVFFKNFKFLRKHLILIPIFSFCFYTGIKGVDFGIHVDEKFLLKSIPLSLSKQQLLPHWYIYPSMTYNLGMVSLIPYALNKLSFNSKQSILLGEDNERRTSDSFKEIYTYTQSHRFKINLRSFFIFISSLSIVWTFLIVLIWRNSTNEAMLAAVLHGSIWEIAYHSRFLIPDPILTHFILITLFFIVKYIQDQNPAFIFLASIFAGLSTSTKYTGGIILIFIILVYLYGIVTQKKGNPLHLLSILFLFSLSFIIITPGSVVEPLKFIEHVIYEIRHYKYGLMMDPEVPGFKNYKIGHGPNSVSPGLNHFYLVTSYLALTSFSNYYQISLIFFVFAIFGILKIIKEKKMIGVLLILFPISYILYMSSQKVMFVRNYLMVIPIFCMFSSIGIFTIRGRIKNNYLSFIMSASIIIMLIANFSWLYTSAQTINKRNNFSLEKDIDNQSIDYDYPWPGKWKLNMVMNQYKISLVGYIQKFDDKKFYLTKKVLELIDKSTFEKNKNITNNIQKSDEVIFFNFEINNPHDSTIPRTDRNAFWVANKFNFYKNVAGPEEININYFPTFSGDPRILALPTDQAIKTFIISQ